VNSAHESAAHLQCGQREHFIWHFSHVLFKCSTDLFSIDVLQ